MLLQHWKSRATAQRFVLTMLFMAWTALPAQTAPARLAHALQTPSAIAIDTVLGVFEGRTPCGDIVNEFTGFPRQNCEKVKWRLTLFRHPSTGVPTRFLYEGTRTSRHGTLTVERRSGPGWTGVVYHLASQQRRLLSLLSVDDRVLVLLDADMRVLPGDASWSNVLNRVGVNRE